jgi:Protein of unknown function DUF262
MAQWETKTVADVVSQISDNQFVLPVIQQRLVWEEEKMELLFDTLLKGNSFGGIMVIHEEKGDVPLFASRFFSKDGTDVKSIINDQNLISSQYFVIDGQQRLQSFYIGLTGSMNGKLLYFNLASDYKTMEYDFKFASEMSKIPQKTKNDDGSEKKNFWYPVERLYKRLRITRSWRQIVDEVCHDLEATDLKEIIRENIFLFYDSIFTMPTIGVSKVIVNRALKETDNKQRIVELFRRLNDGGTNILLRVTRDQCSTGTIIRQEWARSTPSAGASPGCGADRRSFSCPAGEVAIASEALDMATGLRIQ